MNEVSFSIIIPHKNIPNLLQRCLDSIPQRDDLEIIVVDDNSDPAIVDFEKFPGKDRQDTTIILDKSGKGAGRARNIGLEKANGKWLLFADADDYFSYCIKDILEEYKDCKTDIVFFNVIGQDSDTYLASDRGEYIRNYHSLYKKNPNAAIFHFKYDQGCPWAKLIRKEIVDSFSIRFDETRIHNDTTFSYMVAYHANDVKVDCRAVYCNTYRSQSISFTIDDDKILTRMDVLAKRDRFYIDNGIDLGKISVQLHIGTLVSLLNERNKELYDKCLKIFETYGFCESDVSKRIKTYKKNNVKKKISAKLHYIVDKIFM